VQTRRRESGRGAEATARRPAATHPDVRRTVQECTEAGGPAGHAAGQLLGALSGLLHYPECVRDGRPGPRREWGERDAHSR
jgi:hypothetical protein